jgi:hypothetical protein
MRLSGRSGKTLSLKFITVSIIQDDKIEYVRLAWHSNKGFLIGAKVMRNLLVLDSTWNSTTDPEIVLINFYATHKPVMRSQVL